MNAQEGSAEATDNLFHLLSETGDNDTALAIARIFATQPATSEALGMECFGNIAGAQQVLLKAMRELSLNRSASPDVSSSPTSVAAPIKQLELDVWEHRWIQSAKDMSQWSLLDNYATTLQLVDLSAEVASMECNWEALRRLRSLPSFSAQMARGSTSHKLLEVMLCLADGKTAEADRLCAQASQMALLRWRLLPPICGSSRPHRELFHLFHRVTELRESACMISQVSQSSTIDSMRDIKKVQAIWRQRLPEDWDSIHTWDSVMLWRIFLYQKLRSSISSTAQTIDSNSGEMTSLHDSPWTVIRLAKAARKHNLTELTLAALSKLHDFSTMQVADAFEKVREQILTCLANASGWHAGLSLITSTNLEYFDDIQKAELFRLRGVFYSKLGKPKEAQLSFSKVT